MPYKALNDLPHSVRDHLPKHAQEIFRAAFNSAEEQYKEEERAFRVAWAAVKDKYEKGDDGDWHAKPDYHRAARVTRDCPVGHQGLRRGRRAAQPTEPASTPRWVTHVALCGLHSHLWHGRCRLTLPRG